jgi:archaellum component FlaC
MEKLDIILWILGGGFGLMLVMWHSLNGRMDKMDSRMDKMDDRFDRIDDRFLNVEKEFSSLNTRLAVIESKIIDINTNVGYLMWHSQAIPSHKEVQEE